MKKLASNIITTIVRCTIAVTVIVYGNHAKSQYSFNKSDSLSQATLDATISYTTIVPLIPSANFIDANIVLINPPILFPNFITEDVDFADFLQRLERVPTADGTLGDLSQEDITTVLLSISEDTELSTLVLNDFEQALLNSALEILYLDVQESIPTQAFAEYMEHEDNYNEIASRLEIESNLAQRTNLLTRLNQIERDWRLFGYKDEIEAALDQLSELQEGPNSEMLESWRNTISDTQAFLLTTIESSLLTSDWIRVSISSPEVEEISPILVVDHAEYGLPHVERLSFDFTVVPIQWPALTHPFIADDTWRTTSGKIISDGDTSSTADNELVPRVVSGLLIIKNFELVFDQSIEQSVVEALANAERVSVSGVPLQDLASGGPSFQRRLLTSSNPAVISAIVSEVRRSPSPDPSRRWPD